MRIRSSLLLIAAAVLALVTVGFNSAAMAQQVTGAIFTTNADSTFVNGNVYDFDEDVYLNGGPRPNAPCTAAGLPNGDYYFQVTDPSGATLLSTDPITNRRVTVSGGLMVAHSGTHITGIGKCNDGINHTDNITVQLMPFSLTPNPGGEYKAWMTKVSDYAPTSTKGSYGFIPNKSKTDNFKVLPPPVVGDCPDDVDCDGIPDSVDDDIDGDGIPNSLDGCPFDPTNSCPQ
ncbi:MAG: hypothetical protein Q7J56_02470 [Deltaproteobacteria bacterium]|nr:hypothetical protein [Deltaproteobacteria bacterium]